MQNTYWERVGDRTELQHIDLHSYGHQSCLSRSPGLLLGAWGQPLWVLASSTASCLKLIWSPTGLQTNWLPNSPSYIIVQSPTQYLPITGHRDVSLLLSLEWHVWLSSSGYNFYAVHRSLSSGASVYDCTARFYLVPYCQLSTPTPMEYSTSACLEWHVLPGRRSIYSPCYLKPIQLLAKKLWHGH